MANVMATYVDLVSGEDFAHLEQQKVILPCAGGNYDHGKCVWERTKREAKWRHIGHMLVYKQKTTDLENNPLGWYTGCNGYWRIQCFMTQVLAWSLNLPWKDSVTDNFHLDPFYRHHLIIRSSNHFLFPITHPQTCTSALPMLSILPQSRVPFFAS